MQRISQISCPGPGRARGPSSARWSAWALAVAFAGVAGCASALTAMGHAPLPASEPPPPSLYTGVQGPELPREWRWHRESIRLDAPPPRLHARPGRGADDFGLAPLR